MKGLLWFSMLLLLLGALGIAMNIYTGIFLTREVAAESDLHLSVALSSVAFLIIGTLGLTRASRKLLEEIQKIILLSKNENETPLRALQQSRSLSVTRSLFLVICCVINLISGTISQSGRFPLVHGLFGFALAGITILALVSWFKFISRLFALNSIR